MRLNADYRLEGTIDLGSLISAPQNAASTCGSFQKFSEVSLFHFLSLWQIKNQHMKVQF